MALPWFRRFLIARTLY
jgi:hypothetical protein